MIFLLLLSVNYNPGIDSIINSADSTLLNTWNYEYSGEKDIFYLGDSTRILTKYYDTFGMTVAEDYLVEYFKDVGLSSRKQVFWLQGGRQERWTYDAYRWRGKYRDFSMQNDSLIYLISSDSALYNGSYGGRKWLRMEKFQSGIHGLSSFGNDTVMIFGSSGDFYFSSDGGENFENRDSLLPGNLESMHFINPDRGWLVSNTGIISFTENSGEEWDTVKTGIYTAKDIFFVDSLKGWICTYLGDVYNSVDGGYTWQEQTTPVSGNLNGIYFIDSSLGWVCGETGVIMKTTDGGSNWMDISYSSAKFKEISFISPDTGWVGGTGGDLFFTDDGGSTWSQVDEFRRTLIAVQKFNGKIYLAGERDFLIYNNNQYINMKSYLPNAVCNIIAFQPGAPGVDSAVVIGAHCDAITMSDSLNYIRTPGANDNGTGVNTVREAARIFGNYNFRHPIYYVLYAAEEIGLVGSEYYADSMVDAGASIKGIINLDCLGYDENGTHDIDILTDSCGSYLAGIALDVISLYSLPLNVAYIDSNASSIPSDISSFTENGYSGINFWNHNFGPINTVHDSIHVVNLSMHYNLTKLTLGQLAYMAEYLDTAGVREREIEKPIVRLDLNTFNEIPLKFTLRISGRDIVNINIYDVTGRLVHKVFHGRVEEKIEFAVDRGLNPGIYFLHARGTSSSVSSKFIIVK